MDEDCRSGPRPQAGPDDRDAPERVAAVWSEVLGGQPVDLDDDLFFDLGCSSLVGAAIVARLATATGLPLELRDLYLSPTPRELAGQLEFLRTRLTEHFARVDVAGDWSVQIFAEVLAELGPSAAALFLPEQALLRSDSDGGTPVAGAARVAVLRRARGNGTCVIELGAQAETEPESGPGGAPVVAIRRQDALVRISVEPAAPGPVIRLTEFGIGAPGAADPA